MDPNMDDIDRDTVDNLLTAADSNENIGNNNTNIDFILQQLLKMEAKVKLLLSQIFRS